MGGPGSGRKHDPTRWRKAVELRARGLSLPQIGRRFGITHQGVRHILRRSGPAAALPSVRCCACAAPIGDHSGGGDLGRVYCRACLSARPDAPLADRLRALRVAAGLTQAELARRAGASYRTIGHIECGTWQNPSWPSVRPLIEGLSVELVPGRRLDFPLRPADVRAAVRCRECRRTIAPKGGPGRPNGMASCLTWLARHPEASFGERLRAHRLAAGLTLAALAQRIDSQADSAGAQPDRGITRPTVYRGYIFWAGPGHVGEPGPCLEPLGHRSHAWENAPAFFRWPAAPAISVGALRLRAKPSSQAGRRCAPQAPATVPATRYNTSRDSRSGEVET
jgi:transcriptional regulator with XRE-family HTH domain